MAKQSVTVTVNGTLFQRDIEPRLLLSDFLRHELSLTGTHTGCEHGVCGCCTVLLEGLATRSCLCLAFKPMDCPSRRSSRSAESTHCIHSSRHFGKSTVCSAASARPEC